MFENQVVPITMCAFNIHEWFYINTRRKQLKMLDNYVHSNSNTNNNDNNDDDRNNDNNSNNQNLNNNEQHFDSITPANVTPFAIKVYLPLQQSGQRPRR